MTTGYRGPGRTYFHRLKRSQVGAATVEETWCGIKPDLTRWTQHAHTEITCTRCIHAWEAHLATQEPFAPGERVLYTHDRHPGLMHFNTQYSRNEIAGWSWRVIGAPRTHWTVSQDQRAPAGRPMQLALGIINLEPVGYHTTVVAAVEWTLAMTRTENLVPMYRALRAGLWDPQADHLPLSDTASGTLKETNPA